MTSPTRSVVVRLAMDPASYISGAARAETSTLSLDRAVQRVGPNAATSMERAAKGAGTAETAMGRLNKSAGALGFTLGGLAGVGGAVAVGMSIKWAADYQSALTRLVTTAGESPAKIKQVGQAFLDMAGQVGISADEIAKGAYTAESANFHGAAAVTVMKAASEGARQENADLGKVVNATTTILHDYHMQASDAATVTSQLITAVSHGKVSFDELTGALDAITPLASRAGISIADVTGTLAAMTASGMSADQATQNMQNTLLHLASPTNTMIAELAQLGVSTDDLANSLSQKGLAGTLQMVEEAIVAHLDPATQRVLLPALNASKTAVQDLHVMLGQMPPDLAKLSNGLMDGSVSFKDYRKAINDMSGPSMVMGKNFLSLYDSSQGFNNVLKAGGPAAQTFTSAMSKAFGTTSALNVALQTTGENAGATNAAIKDIASATAQADGNIKGWSEVQGNFNQQLAQFEAHAKSLAIEAGQHLLPILTSTFHWVDQTGIPAIEHIGSGIGSLVHDFQQLPAPIKDTAEALGALALANKIGVFSALASGASRLTGAMGKTSSTVNEMRTSFGIAQRAEMEILGAGGLGGSAIARATSNVAGLGAAAGTLGSKFGSAARSALNLVGGPVVLGIAGLTAAVVESVHQTNDWATALEQGGQAAFNATVQMEAQRDAVNKNVTELSGWGDVWNRMKGLWNDGIAGLQGYASAEDEATQKAQAHYRQLSLGQQLQQDVTTDTNNLSLALDQNGKGSEAARFAAWELGLAQSTQKQHTAELDVATRGLNGALSAQIGLQEQLSQSGLNLDQAQLSAKQSVDQYKSAVKDANLTDDQRQQTLDDVAQSFYGVLDAAKRKADAETQGLPASITANQEIVRQRDALNAVVQQLGFVPPALQGMYDSLNGPTAKALGATQTHVNDMGTAMTVATNTTIPGLVTALGTLATAAGSTVPQAITGAFLPQVKGAGDQAVITAGQTGQTSGAVDGLVRSLLGVPAGTDTSNKALSGTGWWADTVWGKVGSLSDAIRHIPGISITADATQANNTIDAFLQKVQAQGFVGAIWNINPIHETGSGGNPIGLPPVPHKATGGIIEGPGTGTSDNILGLSRLGIPTAAVSPGEFVVNAEQTARNRLLLEGINSGLVGLAGGGYVLPRSLNFPVDAGPGLMAKIQAEARQQLASFSGTGTGAGSPFIRMLGASIAASMGFGSQFNSIDYIFSRESGWNPLAQNPTSTAFGIPQFLNSTWAAYGGKTTDAAQQIRDGIMYMRDRYGSPNSAAAFWAAHHWYDQGGILPPGMTVAMNGTGRPETVRTSDQEAALQRVLRSREFSGFTGGVMTVSHTDARSYPVAVTAGPSSQQIVREIRSAQYQQEFLNG